MVRKFFLALPALLSFQSFACDEAGAFGVQFGSKVGFFAQQAADPQIPGPYHQAWSVTVPSPDPRFNRYLVRAFKEDKLIYEIIGLQEIVPRLASTDDYATRLESTTKAIAERLSAEKGLEFRSSMRGWYSAQDETLQYEVRHHRDGDRDYVMVGCASKRLKAESARKSVKAWMACEDAAKTPANNCLSKGVP